MPMQDPWTDEEQPDGGILIYLQGIPRFTLRRPAEGPLCWQVRRIGEEEPIATHQFRNDLFSGIHSGRIK
ncbi:TPA: hypothetical protein ACRMSW_000102 [Pseudomonas aeruginosa]